jgi:hypothetical protein
LTIKKVGIFLFLGLPLAIAFTVLFLWKNKSVLCMSALWGLPHTRQVLERFELKTSISQMTHVPGGMMLFSAHHREVGNHFTGNSNLFFLSTFS